MKNKSNIYLNNILNQNIRRKISLMSSPPSYWESLDAKRILDQMKEKCPESEYDNMEIILQLIKVFGTDDASQSTRNYIGAVGTDIKIEESKLELLLDLLSYGSKGAVSMALQASEQLHVKLRLTPESPESALVIIAR